MINLVENYDNEDKVCKVNLRKKNTVTYSYQFLKTLLQI